MHWSRWGDPAQAGPLSESAFALVDAFIGTTDTPAVDPAERPALASRWAQQLLDELAGIVGAEHVLTDHETRLHRTRGQVHARPAQAPRGRRLGLARRRGAPGSHDEVAALIDWARRAPRRAGPVRRRHLGRRRAGRPS